MSEAAIRNRKSRKRRKRRKERGGKEYQNYLLKDAERKRVNYRRQQDLPEEERQRRRVENMPEKVVRTCETLQKVRTMWTLTCML